MQREQKIDYQPGRVYLIDIRGPRLFYCADLIKWFQANRLDYQEFKRNGISFEALEATGHNMALKAIESAKAREAES